LQYKWGLIAIIKIIKCVINNFAIWLPCDQDTRMCHFSSWAYLELRKPALLNDLLSLAKQCVFFNENVVKKMASIPMRLQGKRLRPGMRNSKTGKA
jgi:hypothetical protein